MSALHVGMRVGSVYDPVARGTVTSVLARRHGGCTVAVLWSEAAYTYRSREHVADLVTL